MKIIKINLLFLLIFLYTACRENSTQEKTHTLVGYSSQYSVESSKELSIYLSSPQESILKSIHITDAVNPKKDIINLPLDNRIILHSPCASYKDLGCNFASKIDLKEYKLSPSIYKINIETEQNLSNDIYINIKEKKGHTKKIAVVQASMTWEAYNHMGGKDLYSLPYRGGEKSEKVSRLRVKNFSTEAPDYFNFFKNNHFETAFYDDYDLHNSASILEGIQLLILIGHSEYWTYEMRENVEHFVANGGSLLILSGNTMWWKVRIEGENIVVNKSVKEKDIEHNEIEKTGLWHKHPINRPEESFLGLNYQAGGYPVKRKCPNYQWDYYDTFGMSERDYKNSDGMVVIDHTHPIFANTQLRNNNIFGRDVKVVDVELDGMPMNNDYTINYEAFPFANKSMKALAYAWTAPHSNMIRKSISIAEMDYGSGKILHMGSIGWVNALAQPQSRTAKILKNAVKYMQK